MTNSAKPGNWFASIRLAALLALGSCAALPASAEINHFVAGMQNIDDFFLPPPEAGQFIYAQYNAYYGSDTFRDKKGHKVDSLTVSGPGGRDLEIDLDIDLDMYFIVPVLMWVPDFSLGGLRYGAYALLPIGNPSIAANVETRIGLGREIEESTWDLSDLYVQPLWLNWSCARADTSLGYGFYAPTGKYEGGDLDNVGLGFWTHQIQGATRVHLDEEKSLSVVLAGTGEINQDKEDVDRTPGSHFTLNWGIRKNLLDDWLQLGVLGYDVWQITNDYGADTPEYEDRLKDQVHAAGFQIGIPKYGLALKYLHEFDAANRFEGHVVTLFFALPLDLIAEKIGGVI